MRKVKSPLKSEPQFSLKNWRIQTTGIENRSFFHSFKRTFFNTTFLILTSISLLSPSISYKSLQKRRNYEIEGFTNDILILRKQLKTLEKTILKFGPLEDRECVLLTETQKTGQRAVKISKDLIGLKGKIWQSEKDLRNLVF